MMNLSIIAFVVSLTVISLELVLTRVYSLVLWYHFVFLAVSLSILGMGLGGWRVYSLEQSLIQKKLPNWIMSFYVLVPISVALLFGLGGQVSLYIYILISVFPFFWAGKVMAGIFALSKENSGMIYFADLTGAALGVVITPFFFNWLGPLNYGLAVASLGALLLLAFGTYWRKFSFALLGLLVLLSSSVNPGNFAFSDKPISHYLRQGGQIVDTRWNAFSRLDVVKTTNQRQMPIFTDGGAGTLMYRFQGNLEEIKFLADELAYLPFNLKSNPHTLVIGPGGGKEILMGLLAESPRITAVEVNPGMVQVVSDWASYSGDIYNLEQVQTFVGDGRGHVERTEETFDVLYLPLVLSYAAEAGGYALAEDFVFTKEAFTSYAQSLNPEGIIALRLHNLGEVLRVMLTWAEVMEELDNLTIDETLQRIMAIDGGHGGLVVILKRDKFSPQKIAAGSDYLKSNYVPVIFPGISNSLVTPLSQGTMTVSELVEQIPLDIRPVSDDRPFFYLHEKGLPPTIMYLLVMVSLLALVISFYASNKANKLLLGYFALLGLGFMLIEIPLIQRFMLVQPLPVWAIASTVFSLLLAGGLGSFLTRKVAKARQVMIYSLVGIVLLSVGYNHALPSIIPQLGLLDYYGRFLGTFILLFPLGFLMGMPFPIGLRYLAEQQPKAIALVWGLNGVFSVLGSVLAVSLAIIFGFSSAMYFGSMAYLLAVVLIIFHRP